MGETWTKFRFVRIVVYRQGGGVVVFGEFRIFPFSVLHRLVAVPIDIVFASYVMIGAVWEGVFGSRTTRQHYHDQQADSKFGEYFCFLFQMISVF